MTKIISYILITLGTLLLFFIWNYPENIIPYPIIGYIIGFALIVIGIILLSLPHYYNGKQESERIKTEIQKLKTNGLKINVDLSKCIIVENHFTEEQDRYNTENKTHSFDLGRDIQTVNTLFGNSIDNTKKIQIIQTVLKYVTNINGESTTFISKILPYDRINLLFKFEKQKETILYVDVNDSKKYYFDLDFIEE